MNRHDFKVTPDHYAIKADLAAILDRYRDCSPIEILAVASQMVGMIIALQDRRTTSPESAMRTVLANIEVGNGTAIEPINNPAGRA